jgi:hypothetical protein
MEVSKNHRNLTNWLTNSPSHYDIILTCLISFYASASVEKRKYKYSVRLLNVLLYLLSPTVQTVKSFHKLPLQ